MLQILDGRGSMSVPYNHIKPSRDFELWGLLTADPAGNLIERPRLEGYINVPSACYALLQGCWEELPTDRPSMGVVARELRQLEAAVGELPAPIVSDSWMNPGSNLRP